MKHTMTKPCPGCPFRNDLPAGYLTAERITEICESLYRGESFPCHKTTKHDDDGEWERTGKEAQCAGAEIFLAKQGASTQLSRIADRLGLKVSDLDMEAPVCGSHAEMMAAHGHEQAEIEPCSVCDDGCLAPAGYAVGGGVIENYDMEETTECSSCGQFVCEACSDESDEGRICRTCQEQDEQSEVA